MPRPSKKKSVSARRPLGALKQRVQAFRSRRPHRSFRLTERRDYRRSLKLPGYFAFTAYVTRTLGTYKRTFLLLAVVYALLSALLIGIGSQETYQALADSFKDASAQGLTGDVGQLGQAGLLLAAIGTGLNETLSETQQLLSAVLVLLVWLTTIWLLRNLMAGHHVTLRDGLYNAGAPIIAMIILSLIFIVQLVPAAAALIGYSAATSTGLLAGGVETMLFWLAAGLLVLISLFWIIGTFFALVIVSLPGMYPLKALRVAGDLVTGRRIRILLRVLWMLLVVVVAWTVLMLPIILFDGWIKDVWEQIAWLPIVPIVFLALSTLTVIWISAYIYLLYRKVVDDDAKPA